jgi:hypothetical protein
MAKQNGCRPNLNFPALPFVIASNRFHKVGISNADLELDPQGSDHLIGFGYRPRGFKSGCSLGYGTGLKS